MTNPPSASVIITNYNYGRYLHRAIRSVLDQTLPPLEICVVDDGSTDSSLAVAQAFGPSIRLICQSNSGVSAARNRGISETSGDLICLLDADDVWLPRKLELQTPLFANSAVGMVYGGFTECGADLSPLRDVRAQNRGDFRDRFNYGPENIFPAPSSAVIRRTILSQAGGFNPNLSNWADWDMWRRLVGICEVDCVQQPVIKYRVHSASMSRKVDKLEAEVLILLELIFCGNSLPPPAILRRRNEIESQWFLMLAGEYLHAGKPIESVRLLWRAASSSPRAWQYAAQFPTRKLARIRQKLGDLFP